LFADYEVTDIIDVGDGVGADLGDVAVRNAVMVSSQPDRTDRVSFLFAALNEGDAGATVQFVYTTAVECAVREVTVPSGSEVTRGFAPGDEQMILTDLDTRVGALVDVTVISGEYSAVLPVIVLGDDVEQYDNLGPVAGTDDAEEE